MKAMPASLAKALLAKGGHSMREKREGHQHGIGEAGIRLPRAVDLLVTVVMLLTTACGGTKGPAPPTGKPETAKIIIAYGAPSASFAATWIAQDKGLFKKYGIDSQLIYLEGSKGIDALVSDSVHISHIGSSVITAASKGARVTFIAGELPYFTMSLYAKPGIKSFKDLEGKAVAVTSPATTTMYALTQLAKHHHVPLRKLKLIYAHSTPGILAALKAGQADAGILSSPTNLLAEGAGFREIADPAKLGLRAQSGGWAVKTDWAKANPNTILAALKAYMEAIQVLRENPAESQTIMAKYLKQGDMNLVKASYERVAPFYPAVPEVSEAGVKAMLELMDLTNAPDAKTFFDNSHIQRLQSTGFVSQLYPKGIPAAK
jgi:NitT/TauT family transport system substrate-binding protein